MSSSGSKNRENVVPLKPEQKRSAEAALARMPAPMHQLREKSRMQLQVMLRDLFDKADDALFELADKATNNHEQNLFFDSMRQVRLRRKETEAEFFRRIDIGFARLLSPESFADRVEEPEVSLDNMALVENDELEEMVASETMVNRASEQFAEKLQHLTLRMDQLVPAKVYLKNNPVGPEVICQGFVAAAGAIEIDVKARLVLFKLFDRQVMSQLGEVYELLNQQLIDANILPSMRGTPKVQREQHRKPAPGAADSDAAQAGYGEMDEGSEQVLLQLRELLQGQRGGAQGSGAPAPAAAGQGSGLSSQDVLSLLSMAQQRTVERGQPLASASEVKSLLSGLLAQSGAPNKDINQVDEDVINLVSMMFEFILEDRSLAAPMKALLARLQIPMIKVAIADKSFFGKGGHPARRLLNEMATAALGWQDTGEENRVKDALYRKVDETVGRVLADYSKDVSIFEVLLLEFRAFQEKEKRRAKILEQRTIDAEDGKAKSQRARAEVDAALAEITAGVEVPHAAAQLLAAAWSNAMFITCLKEGADSEAFEAQLNTARDLVWSTTATMDTENRQKLLKLVPGLLARLRKGLEDIAFNPYQMGQMFKALEKLHLDILRGKVEVSPPPQQTATEENAPAAESQMEPSDNLVPEPTLAEQAHADAMVELVPESEDFLDTQHLALVSNLTQGSWFEMTTDSGDKCRCRLAAIIKPTGKYIFVNRTGMKVAEQTREGLACALRDGKMQLLDDGMLFDRALESVIGSLRQSRGV
ncbi:DUF1631 domain-containing protein [Gilvimarinus sp. DA14]|uniref:DUF1631 domain-containing protein n=1 Tax=Gilvimarinus sp. DA14 TaxID=2956798 RepID=UPI0020B80311|nr:DUF1631 domain-containing protein [Gilvimarinus sp. DA14]UTF59663.1 DUF1631 domain-containing protein [Gilvimarinus sp. DA14]